MKNALLTTRSAASTFIYDEGDGPSILMIHGMVSTGDCWHFVFDALKDRRRVIAPDLPAHGRSSGGLKPYSIAYYVDWLRDLIDAMEIPTAALIGQSMGGAICAAFAARHPERVERLVLVDALGLSSKIPWSAVRNITASLPDYIKAGITHRIDPYLLRFFHPWAFVDPWGSPRETIEKMSELNQPCEIEVLWAGTRLLLADFLWYRQRAAFVERLACIKAPTLVAWGRHDGILALENAREGIARIPGASLEIFEDSAHEPMLEQPEAFIQILQKFLEQGD